MLSLSNFLRLQLLKIPQNHLRIQLKSNFQIEKKTLAIFNSTKSNPDDTKKQIPNRSLSSLPFPPNFRSERVREIILFNILQGLADLDLTKLLWILKLKNCSTVYT